ncbi:hypothetical protein ACVRXQ_02920 [Streptococcus panodentis]|uniref:Uncharacterized protein n=1 Tax=Streptococcus panodentis TaxID=1581472 RepID=A0ABS5AYV1_9STRE|nr:hypothetical protein [Streptococcus panodentis]MBP2621763.1 hypothetical protein [Streptococcus panodentis]
MLEPWTEDRQEAERIQRKIKKMQEEAAIRSIITAKRALIRQEGAELQTALHALAEEMHAFSSNSLVSGLTGGLSGAAADAAGNVLQAIPQPAFTSPVI